MQRGFSSVVLLQQHRLNPEIAFLVNTLFYEGRLLDYPSVFDRENARLFRRWVLFKGLSPRQTVLIDVNLRNDLFTERGELFSYKTTFASVAMELIMSMINFDTIREVRDSKCAPPGWFRWRPYEDQKIAGVPVTSVGAA